MSRAAIALPAAAGGGNCQYFLRPDVAWHEGASGNAAQVGTAAHDVFYTESTKGAQAAQAMLATVPQGMYPDVLAMYQQWKAWWEELPIDANVNAEIPMAYNPFTGKARQLLGMPGPRRYMDCSQPPNPELEVVGTSDLVVHHANGTLENIDYKTGQVPVPPDSPQMRGLATAAASLFEAPEITSTVLTVHASSAQANSLPMGPTGLAATQQQLADLLSMPIAQAKPNPGSHCRWCPARDTCPATLETVSALVPAQPAGVRLPLSITITTPAHAAAVVSQVAVAKEFLKNVEAAVDAFADAHGGIDMPNGTVYSGKEQETAYPKLNPGAVALLRELGLGAAVKTSTTWADLARVGGKEKAELARTKLVQMGAVKTFTKRVYRERKSKE